MMSLSGQDALDNKGWGGGILEGTLCVCLCVCGHIKQPLLLQQLCPVSLNAVLLLSAPLCSLSSAGWLSGNADIYLTGFVKLTGFYSRQFNGTYFKNHSEPDNCISILSVMLLCERQRQLLCLALFVIQSQATPSTLVTQDSVSLIKIHLILNFLLKSSEKR